MRFKNLKKAIALLSSVSFLFSSTGLMSFASEISDDAILDPAILEPQDEGDGEGQYLDVDDSAIIEPGETFIQEVKDETSTSIIYDDVEITENLTDPDDDTPAEGPKDVEAEAVEVPVTDTEQVSAEDSSASDIASSNISAPKKSSAKKAAGSQTVAMAALTLDQSETTVSVQAADASAPTYQDIEINGMKFSFNTNKSVKPYYSISQDEEDGYVNNNIMTDNNYIGSIMSFPIPLNELSAEEDNKVSYEDYKEDLLSGTNLFEYFLGEDGHSSETKVDKDGTLTGLYIYAMPEMDVKMNGETEEIDGYMICVITGYDKEEETVESALIVLNDDTLSSEIVSTINDGINKAYGFSIGTKASLQKMMSASRSAWENFDGYDDDDDDGDESGYIPYHPIIPGGGNSSEKENEDLQPAGTSSTREETFSGKTISIKGNMPELAVLTLSAADSEIVDKVLDAGIESFGDSFQILAAYDIDLSVNGTTWQPQDYDQEMTITIPNIEITSGMVPIVYRVSNDGKKATKLSSSYNSTTKNVTFRTDHFTIFTIGSVSADSEDADYHWTIGTTTAGRTIDAYYYEDERRVVLNGSDGLITNEALQSTLPSGVEDYLIEEIYATGNFKIGNSLFSELTNTYTIECGEDITEIVGTGTRTQSFMLSTNLKKIIFHADSVTLPANISYLFYECGDLEAIPDNLDFSSVTTANGTFAGCRAIKEVDLSTMTSTVASDRNMIYGATAINKIKFPATGYVPTDDMGWTARWKKEGADDTTSAVASDIISHWSASSPGTYVKISDDSQYNKISGVYYKANGLGINNVYKVSEPTDKVTGYCIQYVKDTAGYYYTREEASTDADFVGKIDDSETIAAYNDTYDLVGTSEELSSSISADYDGSAYKAIATALYFGYPNNPTEIKGTLSDDAYRQVTQDVVWNALYNRIPDSWIGSENYSGYKPTDGSAMATAYAALRAKTYTDIPSDDEITLYVYTPEDDTKQCVVSAVVKCGVTISKVDASGNGLSDAVLKVTGTNGYSNTFTTTGAPVNLKLESGKSYTLSEVTAPTGYLKASDIKFDVKVGTDINVQMVDYKNQVVNISKVDITGDTELKGAELKVENSAGKVIDEWTSDGKVHTISGLKEGEKYTLTETSAPKGYKVAESITFIAGANGTGETIKMVDDYKEHEVTIKKVDEDGKRVKDATLKITGKTVTGDTIDTVEFTTSGSSDEKINLLPGTYKLTETTAPKGYKKAAAVSFKINITDGKKTVKMVDVKESTETKEGSKTESSNESSSSSGTKTLLIYKGDYDTKAYLEGAVLAILQNNTEVVRFTTSKAGPYSISSLQQGQSYVLKEITAPAGYALADDITFTVTNEDQQSVTMYDKKIMDVLGITSPKTEDTTPIIPYLILFIISGLTLLILGSEQILKMFFPRTYDRISTRLQGLMRARG